MLTWKYQKEADVPQDSRAAVSHWVKATINERSHRNVDRLSKLRGRRGKSVAQMALAWLLSLPVITSQIVGVNTLDQWEEITGSVGVRLSEEELADLDEASAWRKEWGEE